MSDPKREDTVELYIRRHILGEKNMGTHTTNLIKIYARTMEHSWSPDSLALSYLKTSLENSGLHKVGLIKPDLIRGHLVLSEFRGIAETKSEAIFWTGPLDLLVNVGTVWRIPQIVQPQAARTLLFQGDPWFLDDETACVHCWSEYDQDRECALDGRLSGQQPLHWTPAKWLIHWTVHDLSAHF